MVQCRTDAVAKLLGGQAHDLRVGLPSFVGKRIGAKDIGRSEYASFETDQELIDAAQWRLMELSKEGTISPRATAPAITGNDKTGFSFDCTTLCANALKARPCDYCYVEEGRKKGIHAKSFCLETTYANEVRYWHQSQIDDQNRKGGLRMFSFGDYIDTPGCNIKIEHLAQDSDDVGMKLKAHTKRPDFVEKYGDDIGTVNVSVDSLGMGVRWSKALELKDSYPSVRIRAVATDPEDLEKWLDRPWADVITLYHGPQRCATFPRDDPDLQREMQERRLEGEEVRDRVCYKDMNLKKTRLTEAAKKVKVMIRDDPSIFTKICCKRPGDCGECLVKCGASGCTDFRLENESYNQP